LCDGLGPRCRTAGGAGIFGQHRGKG
jgi:hypothetical protein